MYRPVVMILAALFIAGCTTTEETVEKRYTFYPLGYDIKEVSGLDTRAEPVKEEKLSPSSDAPYDRFMCGLRIDMMLLSDEEFTREALLELKETCVKAITEECTKLGIMVHSREGVKIEKNPE